MCRPISAHAWSVSAETEGFGNTSFGQTFSHGSKYIQNFSNKGWLHNSGTIPKHSRPQVIETTISQKPRAASSQRSAPVGFSRHFKALSNAMIGSLKCSSHNSSLVCFLPTMFSMRAESWNSSPCLWLPSDPHFVFFGSSCPTHISVMMVELAKCVPICILISACQILPLLASNHQHDPERPVASTQVAHLHCTVIVRCSEVSQSIRDTSPAFSLSGP